MSAVVPAYNNVPPMLSRYDSNLACNSRHRLAETAAERSKVKLVLLLIGANDMLALKGQEAKAAAKTRERFITGYAALLRLIREHRPGAPILSL
eukprot:1748729-Amphidinium_carterae.1